MEDKLDVGKLLEELEKMIADGEMDAKGAMMIKSQLALVDAVRTSNQQLERINHNVKELKLRRAPVGPQ